MKLLKKIEISIAIISEFDHFSNVVGEINIAILMIYWMHDYILNYCLVEI